MDQSSQPPSSPGPSPTSAAEESLRELLKPTYKPTKPDSASTAAPPGSPPPRPVTPPNPQSPKSPSSPFLNAKARKTETLPHTSDATTSPNYWRMHRNTVYEMQPDLDNEGNLTGTESLVDVGCPCTNKLVHKLEYRVREKCGLRIETDKEFCYACKRDCFQK